MKTAGIYILIVLVAALLLCQCAPRFGLDGWLKTLPAVAESTATKPVACNDEAVIMRLQKAVAEAYEGIYDIERDYIVTWERKSADRIVCKARAVFVRPLEKKKTPQDEGGFLQAVNEVFGLARKPGESIWVSYDVYRTLRDGETGGYVFVSLREKNGARP